MTDNAVRASPSTERPVSPKVAPAGACRAACLLLCAIFRLKKADQVIYSPTASMPIRPREIQRTPRLHWIMYGLFYPAILGTAIVFTLQRLVNPQFKLPALSVAMTAWVFFGVSFGSAFKKEDEYYIAPFLFDAWELFEMLVCFSFLGISEPIPWWFEPYVGSLRGAYVTLCVAVVIQLYWRKMMGLKWYAFIDLKLILLGLLVLGALLGDTISWLNWVITAVFAVSAFLYVAAHPYGRDAPTVFFSRKRAKQT